MRSDGKAGAITRRALLAGPLAGLAFSLPASLPARAKGAPPRVATLDYGVATTLIAIGAPPVAVASAADWGVWVVEPKLPEGTIDLGDDLEPNLELLAALRPDLVISTPYLAPLKESLERIAPVLTVSIYAPGGSPLDRARQATRTIGTRIGRDAAAEAFLASAEQAFDALAARVERLAPPPVALVNFMDARHARVFGRASLYQAVMDRIGLVNAWSGETNAWGFQTIGLEELARTPAETRLVAFEPVPPDIRPTLEKSPLWTGLPFVAAGRVSTLPGVLMFGMVPSALRFGRLIVAHLEAVQA